GPRRGTEHASERLREDEGPDEEGGVGGILSPLPGAPREALSRGMSNSGRGGRAVSGRDCQAALEAPPVPVRAGATLPRLAPHPGPERGPRSVAAPEKAPGRQRRWWHDSPGLPRGGPGLARSIGRSDVYRSGNRPPARTPPRHRLSARPCPGQRNPV